tara:strand:- start:242 stop:970 length:729 start_codon:yes stop_codon:yes gene_type:complete
VRNNLTLINVHRKQSSKSEIVTQLIYGDTFKIIKKNKNWIKVKNKSDSYKGFIKSRFFPKDTNFTHKVSSLKAALYIKPNQKIKKYISFGSKIKIVNKNKNFYKFERFWIKKKDVKEINFKNKDIFKNIKKFKNVKYKWGGKHFSGIDCSGLVQLFLNFNNYYCPRDAKDQIKFFKKKIKLNKLKKNDLIFWKGHVAIAISKYSLIHAYGPFKKIVVMPIDKTIKRIYDTASLKVIGIRRIS